MKTSENAFIRFGFIIVATSFLFPVGSFTQGLSKDLFKNPPNEARPRVWWHWMNGNITKEGIQEDLAWMERVGIGGVHNFDANLFTPEVVPNKLVFMTPEWKEAFRYATELTSAKGMELTIAGSPGWSVTGGPWVMPADGMKKYVWTETKVSGGQVFNGVLPKPSSTTGPFQHVPLEVGLTGGGGGKRPEFYRDALVVGFELPTPETHLSALNPAVSSSGGEFDLSQLTDGDLHKTSFLPPQEVGELMWIQYEFEQSQTFKAFSLVGASQAPLAEFNGNPENCSLQVSDDGVEYVTIARVSGSIVPHHTVAFEPHTGKYWRIAYETLPAQPNPFASMFGFNLGPGDPDGVNVAEFVLYPVDRIDQYEDKAGFTPWTEDTPTYSGPATNAIDKGQVVDLTELMREEGSLSWEVPEGEWVIIRLGYSLTGRQNHPASPEATGLEVDKLDEDAVRRYINTYLDMYLDATGGNMGAEGLGYVILDSYEAGHMNWTHDFPQEFEQRRGYSILPWIPVLTGRVVESREASESFLWDFRKTIGEMIAANHYDVIGEELHKRGMQRYTESHENKRIYLADGMDVKRNADIPMSAMWTPGSLAGGNDEEVRSEADIRESASVAHIYGKTYVAAESMTSIGKSFQEHPGRLKRTADLELASGLNRFVIHTSVHQPLDDKKPGFSLGPFGQYFTRHETWAEQARPWIDYLSRSCYLLQQGRNVADILYYYGENTNITWICREKLPEIPAGYEFDFVNATALVEAIEVKNGQLLAPSGNTYRVLILDESAEQMTLPVLKKIRTLVIGGAKLVGKRPTLSPSLSDDQQEFQRIANEVWQHPNVTSVASLELQPDVVISGANNKILFRHRRDGDRDIYWLNNRSEKPTPVEISFRVSGKKPMVWDPVNGKVSEVSYRVENGRTIVWTNMGPWDATFIVFEGGIENGGFHIPPVTPSLVEEIKGPWEVNFQEGRGAPASITMDTLGSWAESEDPGIKYFSGVGTYKNTFSIDKLTQNAICEVSLGDVQVIAEVWVNGVKQGVAWKKPYIVDITRGIREGTNQLEIRVVNTWGNRLIGDAKMDAGSKVTFTTLPFYRGEEELMPSGLMGPVRIVMRR